jgi:hypothetical protein
MSEDHDDGSQDASDTGNSHGGSNTSKGRELIQEALKTPSITMSEHHGDSSQDAPDAGNSHGGSNTLKGRELAQEALKIVNNADTAEVMILELMDKYSFSFARLKELLRGKPVTPFNMRLKTLLSHYWELTTDWLPENNLDVSFSKVKYADIAPKIGLDPGREGDDIPKFDMFCARLPYSVFSQILVSIQDFEWQYGPLKKHDNEEARARFLSAYFNKIVALFSGLLLNKPEAILEGKIITKGRIEYQFKTFGGVTVVFIEVQLNIGSLTEHLNCCAQVIAECDGEFRITLVETLD